MPVENFVYFFLMVLKEIERANIGLCFVSIFCLLVSAVHFAPYLTDLSSMMLI